MLARLLTAFKSGQGRGDWRARLRRWRFEHWRKTFDSLLSEVDEQFKPRRSDG